MQIPDDGRHYRPEKQANQRGYAQSSYEQAYEQAQEHEWRKDRQPQQSELNRQAILVMEGFDWWRCANSWDVRWPGTRRPFRIPRAQSAVLGLNLVSMRTQARVKPALMPAEDEQRENSQDGQNGREENALAAG